MESLLTFLGRRRFFDEEVTADMARDFFDGVRTGTGPVEATRGQFIATLPAEAPLPNGPADTPHFSVSFLHFTALVQWAAQRRGVTYAECLASIFKDTSTVQKQLQRVFYRLSGTDNPEWMSDKACLDFCERFGLICAKIPRASINLFFMRFGVRREKVGSDNYKLATTLWCISFRTFVRLLKQLATTLGHEWRDFKIMIATQSEALGFIGKRPKSALPALRQAGV